MKTEVRIGPQVQQFIGALAPEPRQALTRAIKGLAEEKSAKQSERETARLCGNGNEISMQGRARRGKERMGGRLDGVRLRLGLGLRLGLRLGLG
jgi:hypothetical protein